MNSAGHKNRQNGRRLCAVGIGTVILLTTLIWAIPRPDAPAYAGRSAESWLRGVFGTSSAANSQMAALAAFREMGTNGIAFLVEALDRRDNTIDRFYRRIYPKLPAAIGRRLAEPVEPDALAHAASLVLLNVRDDTPERTLPRLIQLLAAENPRTRLHVASTVQHYSLNYPNLDFARFRLDLARILDDSNDWVRLNAVLVMERAKLGGPELAAALRPALTNSDGTIRRAAQSTLDRIEITNADPPRQNTP